MAAAVLGEEIERANATAVYENICSKHRHLYSYSFIFRINPFKATRVDNFVPNKHVKTSVRTKPIIVSQPHVITKNDVNSKTNGFSPKDSRSTTRTRRPKPWNNSKCDKVPFKSNSGCLSNKLEKMEENHRSFQSSHYPNHTSSECNNIKLAIRNEKSEKHRLRSETKECKVQGKIASPKPSVNLKIFLRYNAVLPSPSEPIRKRFPSHLSHDFSKEENQVVSKSSAVTTADASDKWTLPTYCLTFGKFTSHDGDSMESYYSRFYKMMNEMIRNNLTVATMQVNVQFLQQLQPEWSRFVTIVKQNHNLDTVSYHKLFDVLKQYQKEVNEIRTERIAKNANPLALVAAAQQYLDPYYQAPKSYKSYAPPSKQSSSTRSNAFTKYKGKEIAKPITPPSESASEEDSDPEQAQRDKDLQKNLALIAKYFKKIYKPTNKNLRTSSNSKNKNVDTSPRETVSSQVVQQTGIQCFNCKEFAEKGVPLQAEQVDWLEDTDEEIDEQELEAHYSYMAKIQEVPTADSGTDNEPLEQVDSNVIPDSPNMCDNDIQTDQNAEECDDERVVLANLIANLKLDIDENKKIKKNLKKANASLTQELKECKSILTETSKTLGESNSTRDSCLIALQSKQTELEMYMTLNDRTVDYDKL
ncbi:hypothetical protein Tco_0551275 [Tanacetum coccineum]